MVYTKYEVSQLSDVSPVYMDIMGNYITIIEESDDKGVCYTVARISREGDVEHLAFFSGYAPAEKALKDMVNEKGWAFLH